MGRISWRDIAQRIVYEDEDVIVIHKPAGLAVQSACVGQMDLESLLRIHFDGGYAGIVHRLDQPVEGLLVAARNQSAAGALGRQLQDGRMEKEYLAVVVRNEEMTKQPLRLEKGTRYRLEDYLLRDGRTNRSRVVEKGTAGAKRAALSFTVREVSGEDGIRKALIRIRLETGRHHQIRVQLAKAGWPLAGDRKYGPVSEARLSSEGSSLGLCAFALSFSHPRSGEKMCFRVLPEGGSFLWARSACRRETGKTEEE